MKYKILNILCAVTVCGCVSTSLPDEMTIPAKLQINTEYKPIIEDSYIPGDYGIYKDYFSSTDNLIGLSSSKTGPLEEPRIRVYSGPTFAPPTKTEHTTSFNASANGMNFMPQAATKSDNRDFKALFGSEVVFSIQSRIQTKSGNETSETDISMYVPMKLDITNPRMSTETELLPACYFDGFQIQWNADPDNENGVLAIVEWIGDMLLGEDFPSTYIRRICIFEDTGTAILPTSLFEGIPDAAVCNLTLIRGNIDTLSIEDESYKILAESHEYMSFILIREIRARQ